MKKSIVNTAKGTLRKAGLKLQKHSPEILMIVGVTGTVISTIMACKATLKVDEIVEDTKETMDKIHEAKEKGVTAGGAEYTVENAKKDTVCTYTKTAVRFAKLYAPAVSLGVFSIASILASNNILKKRNMCLTAAFTALNNDFKSYRSGVVNRFGKEVDAQLKNNIQAEEVVKEVTDEETGEKKEVKTTEYKVNPSGISSYARIFGQYTTTEKGEKIINPHWDPNQDYVLLYLRSQENYANDKLQSKGFMFLNDVYEMLGLPRTKAGQVVGWIYDEDNPVGDNYIDFGLYSNYSNVCEQGILLDFNVDGNIWELMK